MDTKHLNTMAFNATLHCLSGCAIGEIAGLIIGALLGLSNSLTILIAVILAFITGYALSSFGLLKAGVDLKKALLTVLAADTLSIAVMEVIDNLVEASVPGALNAGLTDMVFWVTLPLSLGAAFVVAFPVNRYLLTRGQGHALTHKHHHGEHYE